MGNPVFHMSVIRRAEEVEYRLTEEELGGLVQTRNKAGTVTDGLENTFVGHCVVMAQDISRDNAPGMTDREAIKAASKRIMPVVNRYSWTADMLPDPADNDDTRKAKETERQRVTNWARSTFSVLYRYLKAGGKLADLNASDARKKHIEDDAKAREARNAETSGENTPEAKVLKRTAALVTALNQVAAPNRVAALEECIRQLREGVK